MNIDLMGKLMSELRCESNGCITVDPYDVDGLLLSIGSTKTGTHMQCDIDEWVAFRDQVKAGDFDHIGVQV